MSESISGLRISGLVFFILNFLVLQVSLAAGSVAVAEVLPDASAWLNEAEQRDIASHPEWRSLVRYETSRFGRHTVSYVDDPDFFLAPNGAVSPDAELNATIRAFFETPEVQCRFTGRRLWLNRELKAATGTALPVVECAEYDAWRAEINVSQVVLVLASSHLNSPSSMYGHTFLRFDPPSVEENSPLLSYALNFGANIPPAENGFLYAYRGLSGGYPGLFAASPYFEKLNEYSRIDNRDMWEYRLNLTPSEIDLLVAHIWELSDINFDYFFFDENCSLRLLELLDVARPGHDLGKMFPVFAIPVDTIRVVDEAGMVDRVYYRPSSRSVLQFEIDQLDKSDQRLARSVADDFSLTGSSAFNELDPVRQRQVASVAYRFLRYETARSARDEAIAARKHDLLALISDLPEPDDNELSPPVPLRPDLGHKTMLLSLAPGTEEDKAFADFEWRLSYHDLLDTRPGYAEGMSLNMGRIVVRAKEGGSLRLQRLDLIEITSLARRDAFFKPISWRVDGGIERQWTNGVNAPAYQVNGGAGLTYGYKDAVDVFVMVTGRLEYNKYMDREIDLAPGVSTGSLVTTRLGRSLLSVDYYRFTDGLDRVKVNIEHDYTVGAQSSVRFKFMRSLNDSVGVNEVSLGYRYYF